MDNFRPAGDRVLTQIGQTDAGTASNGMELAIIGMAGRFPGAKNLDEFWFNLSTGIESISFFSDEEVEATGVDPVQLKDPHYVKAGGIIEGVELFDAGFFGIYPKEAAIMDPQHRVFLECAWEALENAGYNPENYPGYIGVYAGSSMNTYLVFNLVQNREIIETVHGYQLTISNDKDFLPTRVAYKLNLHGPAINIQTACSTSLVAAHLACQGLLSYQCDMALAGGISIRLPQKQGYVYQEGGILSPDGHCRAFDAQANGTVSGNGVGIVVLKRLADALADGDTIYAVIKGSAINNDGSLKVGYTAPSVEGQSEVIAMAQAVANVGPASIQYIETHGTGTALGDPIEITALTQVFRSNQEEITLGEGHCSIGSVKTNIGHLDAAAGVASLIKTALALKKGFIPPSINFTEPNPKIDFGNGPFYVNTRLAPWKTNNVPRRAGISSFGIGGTNAHMVLEEAPQEEETTPSRPWQMVMLSARSTVALEAATDNLAQFLKANSDLPLSDVVYTLQVGRKSFGHRRMVVGQNIADVVNALENRDPQRVLTSGPDEISRSPGSGMGEVTQVSASGTRGESHSVVFMFPGQGAQYINMARDLYESESIFREQVDLCSEILQPSLGVDLRELIFIDGALHLDSDESAAEPIVRHDGTGVSEAGSERVVGLPADSLKQTAITQPALFTIEYALARLLISWGIQPEAMIGHSIGEYVAACLAGVFSLEDALALVAERGRLMQSMPPGAMISIPLAEREVRNYLTEGLSISAVNTPSLCVVSGSIQAIEDLIYRLANQGVEYRRLRTSHAFHSPMMEPILEPFARFVSRVELNNPHIPFISNLSGTWITDEEATDPNYWTRHLRNCVRFADGVSELLKDPAWMLLEVGPGQTLSMLAKGVLSAASPYLSAIEQGVQLTSGRVILSTIRHPRIQTSDVAFLLNTLGRLWLSGIPVDWAGFYRDERRKRLPLPTYPFERQRYWVDPDLPLGRSLAHSTALAPLQSARKIYKRDNIADWIYRWSWRRLPELPGKGQTVNLSDMSWWLIGNGDISYLEQAGQALTNRLKKSRANVVLTFTRTDVVEESPQNGPVLIGSNIDFKRLIDALFNGAVPERIVFLWQPVRGVSTGISLDTIEDRFAEKLREHFSRNAQHGFYPLLSLVQALGKMNVTRDVRIDIIVNQSYEVTGDEQLDPAQGLIGALCTVINQEYPNLTCRVIDLPISPKVKDSRTVIHRLYCELIGPANPWLVAYRGNHRWAPFYEPVKEIPKLVNELPIRLREKGVYLITGGLGRIGLTLAAYLGQKVKARLALVDRIALPDRAEWSVWLINHSERDATSLRIRQIQAIENSGGRVWLAQAEVSNLVDIQRVVQQVQVEYGALNGVIHAAGLVGERAIKAIQELGTPDCEAQFTPKVYSLGVLAQALRNLPLDFVFLQSSLSAVLGGLGLGAYAAANLYMDGFADLLNMSSEVPWIAVDWDGWQFPDGIPASAAADLPAGSEGESPRPLTRATLEQLSMTPQEGVQIFERLMSYENITHWVISTADLEARMERWLGGGDQKDIFEETLQPVGGVDQAPQKGTGFPRPKLQTPYVAPRNDLEQAIVQVWQKVLGIEPVGVYDDFFELGGHSLLATQLITRVRDVYHVELPLRKLFEKPTVAGLVELIITAQPVISPLTEEIPLLGIDHKTTAPQRIPRNDHHGDLALSFGQQRLWFLDQLEPDSPLYNNFAALKFFGPLSIPALEYSLRQIILRHEALRTVFQDRAGTPVQVVVAASPGEDNQLQEFQIPLTRIDLREYPAIEQMQEVMRLGVVEARRPFNLAQGPLLRVTILQLGAEEHVSFLTMHHIISDGWSVGVLIRELAAFYTGYLSNQSVLLPELPIQYADYATWQHQWLQGEVLERQLAYWKEKLKSSPASLELFTDRPRPAYQTANGASLWFELPERLSKGLVVLSLSEGVTLFITLLAALQTLLYRYSSQEDICVGTPIANRNRAETEDLIGFILNTLVMRTDLSGDPTFRDLLGRVRETALGAYAHQDLPFEMVVDALQPQRDMSRPPFFQVIFDLQVGSLQALELPGLKIIPLRLDSGTAKFDLALSMEETDSRLQGYFNYNTDLFDPETILRLLGHWITLLQGIVAQPEAHISHLPLLTPSEWQQIVVDWNNIATFNEPALFVHQWIEAQAEQRPGEVALVIGSVTLTYQQLNERADQLANYLLDLGVGPEVLVGLCVERSPEMIVGLLGVMKAGGAFLPLDPTYPRERLAFMVVDSQIRVMLTQSELVAGLQLAEFQADGLRIVCLDTDWPVISRQEIQNTVEPRTTLVAGENLAYVIYTSGSTGKPKGVMITHQSIANHCRDMQQRFGTHPGDRVLQFASLNFDAALEQVFVTLMVGAQLVLRENEVWTSAEFHRKIAEYGLTVVNIPPAYWYQWAAYAVGDGKSDVNPLPQLRLVIVGGDVMPVDSVNLWRQTTMSQVRVLNAYGPTETTITATTYEIPSSMDRDFSRSAAYGRVPIGRPHPNRTAYILDPNGNPVPIGVPGELHLGGAYLARGYLNRPDLTEENFIPDPFPSSRRGLPYPIPVLRLYKTGDLARFLPGGTIDFLGRIDQQVKLRGFRIELGEIEAALITHPEVNEVIVLLREDTPGDTRLVAYIVPVAGSQPDSDELLELLKEKLPVYMLPAAFVFIEGLPLTPSGKIDRRVLPVPEQIRQEGRKNYVAPRNPIELELAHLWAEVLKIPWREDQSPVGVFDNFFELGGHSLLATQLLSRVQSLYRVELPLRQLFENPTIAGLAGVIADSLISEEEPEDLAALLEELEQISDEDATKQLKSSSSEDLEQDG